MDFNQKNVQIEMVVLSGEPESEELEKGLKAFPAQVDVNRFYPGWQLVIIQVTVTHIEDLHLNILDRLYKEHEILAWAVDGASSATYNL